MYIKATLGRPDKEMALLALRNGYRKDRNRHQYSHNYEVTEGVIYQTLPTLNLTNKNIVVFSVMQGWYMNVLLYWSLSV